MNSVGGVHAHGNFLLNPRQSRLIFRFDGLLALLPGAVVLL
jgi:hypothetical protein